MKRLPGSLLSCGALVALAALLAFTPSATGTGPATARAVAAVEDPLTLDKLKEEVLKRDAVGDSAGVASLLKANPQGSVVWVIDLNELFAAKPDERLGKEMKMLRAGWRRAYDSDFFENTEKYLALLPSELKAERNRLRQQYNNLYQGPYYEVWLKRTEYDKSMGPKARALSTEFEQIALAFTKIGDLYHASQSFMHAGYLVDSTMIHVDADLARAYELLKLALDKRKLLDLEDNWAHNLMNDIARLELLVVPPEPAGGEGAGGGEGEAGGAGVPVTPSDTLPGVALGPTTTSEGTFESLPEIDVYERLGYATDAIFMVWPQVFLRGEGTNLHLPGMPNDGPVLHRTGASAVEIVGADGTKQEIPLTGRAELVTTTVGTAEAPRPWAMLVKLPSDKEQYQGFEVNYAPTKEQMVLAIAPAGGMRHEVGGVPVLVLDENLDGVYGGPATTWSFPGVVEGSFQFDVDALVIGKSKRAVPFSELVNVEGKWYRLESVDAGARLAWQLATLRTGKVKLEAKGIDPDTVIVKGGGPLANCYFDLAASKGGIELPAGTYELLQGTVSEGKRMEVEKALFLGSPTTTFTVAPGGTVAFAIGAPFDVQAKVSADATHVRVEGDSLVVTGRAGERYQRLWGYPLKPEIAVRKKGAKRANRPEKMPLVLDQATLNEKGLPSAWSPLDLELEHELDTGEIEVQFTQKKHPLFGNLASEWR